METATVQDEIPPVISEAGKTEADAVLADGGGVRSIVVISDLHGGCQMALCPPGGVRLDGGGQYKPHRLAEKLWDHWQAFWKWALAICRDEPFMVVVNGDMLDGRHHGATTQISQNLADQQRVGYEILSPIRDECDGNLYIIRGTASHTGESGENEEQLAERLGAIKDEIGNRTRYEMWVRLCETALIHFAHHIGTTGSAYYESTAVMKELIAYYSEAGQWHNQPPDVVVRSHRHRHIEVRVPTALGYGITFVTAAWQLKPLSSFIHRMAGARVSTPQIGGSVIRFGDEDLYTRHKVWGMERAKEVVV